MSDTSAPQPPVPPPRPALPPEVKRFKKTKKTSSSGRLTRNEWLAGLRDTEVRDKRQKLWLRPAFAAGVYVLLIAQNIGIYFIVFKALEDGTLIDLQLIFSALIAGTLAQSYLILRLIAERVFGEITYDNNKADQ